MLYLSTYIYIYIYIEREREMHLTSLQRICLFACWLVMCIVIVIVFVVVYVSYVMCRMYFVFMVVCCLCQFVALVIVYLLCRLHCSGATSGIQYTASMVWNRGARVLRCHALGVYRDARHTRIGEILCRCSWNCSWH